MGIISSIFGTHSDHEIKRIMPTVNKVMELDESFQKLTDEELILRTGEFFFRAHERRTP